MATAVRGRASGLSADDLETIRDALAAGRKPKVLFTEAAGQVAGQTGQVVKLTNPELSEEFVVVRFGRDELPFSPTDLAIPTKSTASRRAAPAETPPPELKIVREKPVPTPRQEKPVPTTTTLEKPALANGSAPANGAAPAKSGAPIESAAPGAATSDNGKSVVARKTIGKGPKVKAPAALTITLAYADGEWTVAAQQGTKPLAKPYLIRPSEALKMVGLLDAPGVQEAVEHILSVERAEAEHQAEKLRSELAEIEAKLADLRAAS